MDSGEKELRKAFEEVTTRNVQTTIDYSKATRQLIRDLQEKVERQQNELTVQKALLEQFRIQLAGVNSYTYTTSETISTTPATGTIIATFAFINEATNASGIADDTRIVGTDQPVLGWARKSTGSPYYQQGVITGTVDNVNGLSLTIQLVGDE